MSKEQVGENIAKGLIGEQPPQITPEEWQSGLQYFNMFLKEIKIRREGSTVHIDWIFVFPSEEIAKAFVNASRIQFGQTG